MPPNDAVSCRQIVRAHARTFWVASQLLPAEKRRAAFALYAFCRTADDIVDSAVGDTEPNPATRLGQFRLELATALAGEPAGPVFRELAIAVRTYGVPERALIELLDGVAQDCPPARYRSWDELSRYCEGVASSVGEMCTYIFGVVDRPDAMLHARHYARTLGVAMQLTNILRDVGEDAENGRCYLPDEDLARFGLRRSDVLNGQLGTDSRWRMLMRFEIARARALYAQAAPGIALLSPDARRCASACSTGYAAILGAIESIDYDTFRTRARLGSMARAAVLWAAWRTPLDLSPEKAQAKSHAMSA
ncbi:MAG: pys [Gemmatimonadetes bacterium]|nr:pys [Gemmatimonadota bacterium]